METHSAKKSPRILLEVLTENSYGYIFITFYLIPHNYMPAFDGTGPAGQGPLTGHGKGPCAGGTPMRGRGWCPFMSAPRGWRFWERGSASLEEQEQFLEEELKAVRAERKTQKN